MATAKQADVPVSQYMAQVSKYEPLSREAEMELAVRFRDHDDQRAADRLVRAHMRYVVATAIKYKRYGVPLNELISEGNFGLVHALRKFDPDRGFRFVTYAAYWIRAYILNYIIRSWSLVGSGSGALRSKMFFKLRRERVRLANLVGDRDEAEEMLAKRLNVSRVQLTNMLRRLEARDVSLDTKVFDDSATSMVDTLVSPDDSQESQLATDQVHDRMQLVVSHAVDKLDPRERYIVETRLMSDPEERASLAEIGRKLGVSRERARQLEARAKMKLRNVLVAMPDEAKPEWLTPELLTRSAA